jgi:penicillin amidase
MRILRKVFLTLVFILAGVILFVYVYLQMQRPVYSGTVEIPDLQSKVTTYFDKYGVPHIYGEKETDVFCALGYIHAKERLFQMELVRRISSGRLSEILGSKMLEADKFFRMLGLNRRAEESQRLFMQNTDTIWKKDILAYINGINQYIEKRRKRFEFLLLGIPKEKYTVKDIYLIVDFIAFDFQMAFKTDPLMSKIGSRYGESYLKDIGVGKQSQLFDTANVSTYDSIISSIDNLIPVRAWTGSNAFAVAAERSQSGKALFENDTHVGVQQPAVWYEAHLECPGFSIYGSFLAGFPFPALGHNRNHAWGLTILENDDLDFFAEHLKTDDSSYVKINDQFEKIQVHPEIIHVKDSADVMFMSRSTSHGPICSDAIQDFSTVTTAPVSACWTLLKFPSNLPEVTWQMCHSNTLMEFRDAVSKITAPGLNIIYADSADNIAWFTAAKFVKRKPGINPDVILDGNGGNDWLGFYDFSYNPRAENPVRGVVLSANNPPVSDSIQWFPGYYAPPDRLIRINQFFHSKKILNLQDLQIMNNDVINVVAAQNVQILLSKLRGTTKLISQIHERAVEILDQWNGSHELNDAAPVIYYKWLYHILHDAMADELGEQDFEKFLKTHVQKSMIKPFLQNDSSTWWDNINSKHFHETETMIVENAFDKTIQEIIEQFGPEPEKWAWRKVHQIEIEHPVGKQKPFNKIFNIGPYPDRGGVETLNNQSFDLDKKGIYKVNLSPGLRRTVDFANPENAYSISPSGQSGNFMSGYYRDQTRMYLNGNVRKEMMNKKEIESTYNSKMVFEPQR